MCSPSTSTLKSAMVGVFTPSNWQMLQSRLFVFSPQRAGFSAVAHCSPGPPTLEKLEKETFVFHSGLQTLVGFHVLKNPAGFS